MYRIIGGDGREYGPVSADQVRQWVRENRANAETRACVEGSAEWKPLREFPEFADLWGGIPPWGPAPAPGFSPPPASSARERVKAPAIGLLITAALGALVNLFGLIWYAAGQPLLTPHEGVDDRLAEALQRISSTVGILGSLLGLVVAALVAYGAVRMMKLESFGWALAASILALIPCTSPCCILGLPIGIWALIVLYRADVQTAFGRSVAVG